MLWNPAMKCITLSIKYVFKIDSYIFGLKLSSLGAVSYAYSTSEPKLFGDHVSLILYNARSIIYN